jgi:glycolate oxidase
MAEQQHLDRSVIKALRNIVGPANLFTGPEELVVYSYDATRAASLPGAVARPFSAEEVSRIVTLANQERFPVVPRGAGTGMSGGSVPVQGGVVLSFERMDRILELDEQDRIAVVQPGVITGDLQREAESRGLFYPPDPASAPFCTIGGNVAECAGGLRAVKYGVTRDYVLGLEVVLPTGEIIRTGARTLKSVAGYDLTRLIIGSEGTLGIVTEITVRLLPLPESVHTLAAWFPDAGTAASVLSGMAARRILPRAFELVDGASLRAVARYLKSDIPSGADAMLLIETDGPEAAAGQEIKAIEDICRQTGATVVVRARNKQEQDRLWTMRKSISPALNALKPKKINEDIVVPVSRIPGLLREIGAIAARYGVLIACFGHAGDGNIHVNVMLEESERPRAEAAVKEVLTAVVRMRGSISGEHGIGISKAAYLPMEAGPAALAVMKRIKQALDPNGILNPGKIFLPVDH